MQTTTILTLPSLYKYVCFGTFALKCMYVEKISSGFVLITLFPAYYLAIFQEQNIAMYVTHFHVTLRYVTTFLYFLAEFYQFGPTMMRS